MGPGVGSKLDTIWDGPCNVTKHGIRGSYEIMKIFGRKTWVNRHDFQSDLCNYSDDELTIEYGDAAYKPTDSGLSAIK